MGEFMKESIESIKNKLKETGFKIAFAGGSRKALQSDNKYVIPRYPILNDTSFEKFIEMVS